jgi:hypothetical protein
MDKWGAVFASMTEEEDTVMRSEAKAGGRKSDPKVIVLKRKR